MRDLIERKMEKTKLETMAEALQNVIYDDPEKNEYVSRIILGSNEALSDRKGLIFGAYDINEKELAAEFLSYAVHLLNEIREIEELEDLFLKTEKVCHASAGD